MSREAREVAKYLNGLPRTVAEPVEVKIGRTTYPGAVYAQIRDVPTGTRAYFEGEREYVHSAIYLLGSLPPSYARDRVAYVFDEGGDRRWFVGSFFPSRTKPTKGTPEVWKNEFHPFGPMFQLMRDGHGVTAEHKTMRARAFRVKGAA